MVIASQAMCTVCDPKLLHRLHQELTGVFNLGNNLGVSRERARERAFSIDHKSHQYFAYWYLMSAASSKYQQGFVSARNRAATAYSKFADAEVVCQQTNDRLYDAFNRPSNRRHWSALSRARRIVSEVLGRFDPEVMLRYCSFSSGASTEARRERSMVQIKWDEASHVTKGALPYVLAFSQWTGQNIDRSYTVVGGNVVFTVPKNYERDRTCAKEPSWNMFFQKGVGGYIRSRLLRVGLLHSDAQETHARLAREASETGSLATLDLKAASDSISNALVDLLVDDEWKKVLFDLRSPIGLLPDGTSLSYEKVSSMGNGYTFELETLLFYALTQACCGKDELVSVYGDDIICPSSRVAAVTRLLKHCGFETNPDKSFASGPFRESCGGHYYRGHDVKPFYIQRLPTTLPQLCNLHNDIVAWIGRTGLKLNRLVSIARLCRRLVPRKYWGPLGTAGALWAEWDEARPRFVRGSRRPNQPAYHHWRISTVREGVVRQRHDYLYGAYLAALWGGLNCTDDRKVQEALASDQGFDPLVWSELSFSVNRVQFGWQAVGVGRQWPRLPVRLA